MLPLRRLLFIAQLNEKLFGHNSSQRKMAPVTRYQTKSTSLNGVIDSTNHKSTKTESIKMQPTEVNKQKRKSKDQQSGRDGLPIVTFPSQNEFEHWLKACHVQTTGIWVKIAKKSSGIPSINYEELLDVLLCYGWIDGTRTGFDDTWFLQRISPRRSKSTWSQINREKVKRLIRMGKMQPAGQILIDQAKADGRWDNAYKPTSGCVVPDELVVALEESSAKTFDSFKALSKPEKLILLNRINRTESENERSECIRSIVSMFERDDTSIDSLK